MQEQICKVIPACPEDAFLHSDDKVVCLGGRRVFDYQKWNRGGLCITECCGAASELK
jgi:hypothetical protein